jgi:hypothetical protein
VNCRLVNLQFHNPGEQFLAPPMKQSSQITGAHPIWLAGAFLIAVGCMNSDANARKAAPMKASTAQQQKPITLRS